MNDLVEWLRARLDEDERVARATIRPEHSGRWEFDEYDDETSDGTRRRCWEVRFDEIAPELTDRNSFMGPSTMRHIARWDPARVLAEVDAKRRILADFCDPEQVDVSLPGGPPETMPGRRPVIAGPLVRLLALPYAARPGYREEWRP